VFLFLPGNFFDSGLQYFLSLFVLPRNC